MKWCKRICISVISKIDIVDRFVMLNEIIVQSLEEEEQKLAVLKLNYL